MRIDELIINFIPKSIHVLIQGSGVYKHKNLELFLDI